MVLVVGKSTLTPPPFLASPWKSCSVVDELRRRRPWCCSSTISLAVTFSLSKYYLLSAPSPGLTRAILQEDQDQDYHLLSLQTKELFSSSNSQLYVCNLPRNYGISELVEIFTPYGTVQSVEVSRDAETGISRGCGYVTMSSIAEANAAIAALDASDVGGREMRVRFSTQMTRGSSRHNLGPVNLSTRRDFMFESPYKIYVGNLAWSVTPADLRNLFSQFGTVVSARLLHDRKTGKTRVYGFLSFSSASEREAALSLDGRDFCSRKLLVRDVFSKIS